MIHLTRWVIATAIGFAVVVLLGVSKSAQEIPRVPLVRLLAAPDEFDGKVVWTAGYFQSGMEDEALYISELDGRNFIPLNGIWLDWDGSVPPEKLQKFKGRYLMLKGTFLKGYAGHMGLYSGRLSNVREFFYTEAPESQSGQ